MNEKTYYSLRYIGYNAFHPKGHELTSTSPVLHIGETADCAVRYEAGRFEPEYYASIVANEDGESWRLIQRSSYVKSRIAGIGGFGYVHQLKDGDVISFDGQQMELEFHVHHDCNYGHSGVIIEQRADKRITKGILTLAAFAIILSCLGLGVVLSLSNGINSNDLKNKYRSSVFMTRVDSVQWIEIAGDTTRLIRPTLILESNCPVGTAFLTTDRKLITARHCIEYWVGKEIDVTEKVEDMYDDDIRKWAILSETFMQERENEEISQQLRVFFSVYNDQDEAVFRFSSTDESVHINRFHDNPLEFCDFDNCYFWRGIRSLYQSDLDIELGDIVYIDIEQKGEIELADSSMIAKLNQSSEVAILGHPGNASGRRITFAKGNVIEDRDDTIKSVSPDIIIEANIAPGFSGGPVFIRENGRYVVVGVVSKIDADNGIYKKAVPVTEIIKMEERGKEEVQ